VHDAHIELSFVFDDEGSEFTLAHSSFPMKIIQGLDISVEFEGCALASRLFLYA
jgi:hypothetical protein